MSDATALDAPAAVPERQRLLPYGRQSIDEDDIAAVVEVLRGDGHAVLLRRQREPPLELGDAGLRTVSEALVAGPQADRQPLHHRGLESLRRSG